MSLHIGQQPSSQRKEKKGGKKTKQKKPAEWFNCRANHLFTD